MTQYAFFFDETRCTDCRACSVACRDWNSIDAGPVKWLRMFSWEVGAFPDVRLHYLFAPCYHCNKPLCLNACPNNAIYKEDKYGAVLVDPNLCQGARKCWVACPYGAPQFADDNPGTKMSKCNMCIERLEKGQLPVCVLACPTRALDFGPIEKMIENYGEVRALPEMPDARKTGPSVIFKPRAERKKVIPYDPVRAIQLMCKRGDLPPLYDSPEAITNIPHGVVKRDHLVMKPRDSQELMEVTRNDEG